MKLLLETERLVLRQFVEEDADHLFELDNDPEVMRFLNGGTPTSRQVIQQEILPRFIRYHERFFGYGFWAAISKSSNEFLGWISFRPSDWSNLDQVCLGFRFRKAAWGRGYATEGARALVRLGFTGLGVSRVVATTYEDNWASRRVLEKLGFTLVRTFRMTPGDLKSMETYHVTSNDVWDGNDLEYVLEKAGWEQQSGSKQRE